MQGKGHGPPVLQTKEEELEEKCTDVTALTLKDLCIDPLGKGSPSEEKWGTDKERVTEAMAQQDLGREGLRRGEAGRLRAEGGPEYAGPGVPGSERWISSVGRTQLATRAGENEGWLVRDTLKQRLLGLGADSTWEALSTQENCSVTLKGPHRNG